MALGDSYTCGYAVLLWRVSSQHVAVTVGVLHACPVTSGVFWQSSRTKAVYVYSMAVQVNMCTVWRHMQWAQAPRQPMLLRT